MMPASPKALVRDDGVDLTRLNAAERSVLDLLAQGHTAKSIATITGRSVGAVNERLREARRKTGMGSSRELARIFAAQENRDDLIGVASEVNAAASIDRAEAAPHRRAWARIGVTVMFLTAIIALASATLSFRDGSPPQLTSEVNQLHDALLAETRDPEWAADAERRLDAIYAPIRSVGPITIACGRTLCEVSGEIASGDASAAIEALQRKDVYDRVRAAGFVNQPLISFSSDAKGAPRFVTFWRALR